MNSHAGLGLQPDTPTVYTVSRFNAEIKRLLLDRFKFVWLEGEISNLSRPGSGHIYFSLKDDACRIQCAMFKTNNRQLNFEPEDGLQVMVQARPDLYEVRGSFQLVITSMKIAGRGDLHARFEKTKHALEKEGLFAPQRKQSLPTTPRRVGVITSKDGAAVHDVLTTLDKLFPAIEVFIYPTPVQGDKAPESICAMIEVANTRCETDVLILARGGGSLEDLWAFNEERVARSIAASKLPIITGIGHETDFTIADFVADERAPTPTGAAQRTSPDAKVMMENTAALARRMQNFLRRQLETSRQTLSLHHSHLLRFHPSTRIEHWAQQMDDIDRRLLQITRKCISTRQHDCELVRSNLIRHAPLERINIARVKLENNAHKLKLATQHAFECHHTNLKRIAETLQSLNPLSILKRGYSIVTDSSGAAIRSAMSLAVGQKIKIRVEKGNIEALVKKLRD